MHAQHLSSSKSLPVGIHASIVDQGRTMNPSIWINYYVSVRTTWSPTVLHGNLLFARIVQYIAQGRLYHPAFAPTRHILLGVLITVEKTQTHWSTMWLAGAVQEAKIGDYKRYVDNLSSICYTNVNYQRTKVQVMSTPRLSQLWRGQCNALYHLWQKFSSVLRKQIEYAVEKYSLYRIHW